MRLTKKELEVMNDMCDIASSHSWGEGDYRSWDGIREQVFGTLRNKIQHEIASRKAKQGMRAVEVSK